MTKFLLVAVMAVSAIGCENLHQTIRAGRILGDQAPAQTALIIGNHSFTNLDNAELYIRSLPHDAIFSWDINRLGDEKVPLPPADVTVNEFGNFCRQNGAAFKLVHPSPGTLAPEVLVLRPSGLTTLFEILGSPAMNAPDSRQLFSECNVPYVESVSEFFKKAIPELSSSQLQTSVIYDAQNHWLIVYQPSEFLDRISRVIWSYQTRDFDDKMQCLAGRMKARRYLERSSR